MSRTKENLQLIEMVPARSGLPPIGPSKRVRNNKLEKCGHILLTKEKRESESMFKLSVGNEYQSDGCGILPGNPLPKIHLCWQSESGEFDSVEMHALRRVINILKALGQEDEWALTSERKDQQGSQLRLGQETCTSTELPSRGEKTSHLLIDLTGDDDNTEVPNPVNLGRCLSLEYWPAEYRKKRVLKSHEEEGHQSCPPPKRTRRLRRVSQIKDLYHDQLTQKIARGFTEMRKRTVQQDMNLHLDRHVKKKLLQVDEVFQGPRWKTSNHRRRVTTLIEQFHHLRVLFTKQNQCMNRSLNSWKAGKYMRTKGYCFNENVTVVGEIPGVEVGDSFLYREELFLLLIHRRSQGGIDYIPAKQSDYKDKKGNPIAVAASVVSSGRYEEDEYFGHTLIYAGEGGNQHQFMNVAYSGRQKDQELTRGNLALKNSCDLGVPVRVTLRSKEKRYVYCGLFDVEHYYQEPDSNGFQLWKFRLVQRDFNQESVLLGSSADIVSTLHACKAKVKDL